MPINNSWYTSSKDEWATPQAFFDELDREFHFTVDVCATRANAKCGLYFTAEMDGLQQDWGAAGGWAWCNPPYGKTIGKWLEKAAQYNAVCLVPSRTDTRWFWNFVYNKAEIRFIKGRLHFNDAKNSAPFPSLLAIYRGGRQ